MDYYNTLGLQRGATADEIKKAYRSLAMKHHPDRGGEESKFKEISTAYEVLSDPEKRRMFDAGIDPNNQQGYRHQGAGNPFEFHFNSNNFEDIFGNFGFGFGQRPMARNRSMNINVEITLEDVLNGKQLNAEVGIPGGKPKIITISIPAGIENGQQIKYTGMGDDSIPNVRPGDLIVNIFVKQHNLFKREGDSLVVEKTISIWDAILGSSLEIETLDKKTLSITIPPGTQSETILGCKGEGLPHIRTRQRGTLLIKIRVNVPKNLTQEQIQSVQALRNQFQ